MSEKRSSAGSKRPDGVDYSDENITLDAHEDRWAWRARLRRNRATHLAWRSVVGIVGGLVTVAGLVMVPAPGPGWLIVFFGLMILASEFEFAQRILMFARRQVGRWNDWVMAQPVWVRGLVAFATLLLVLAIFWGLFALTGVPGFLPGWMADPLRQVPGVA
ncbi:MAG: TIGR02611 family protein [Intrasporangium sp.]|uniref:TIGR02611 family protein n=1 Tax=Intrasporangium sp. TaxID=1925024 RepID=UPI002649C614|nr:TIGR02611 family protein [Intrasporangium sp.]MDN5794484.1 TIGR02611 family protein [Intrasporangium sp.]